MSPMATYSIKFSKESPWTETSWESLNLRFKLAFCAGNSPVTGEFPSQRPVTRIFFFMFSLICALNKWLSKQSRGWWFETPLRSLWRHCYNMGEEVRRVNFMVYNRYLMVVWPDILITTSRTLRKHLYGTSRIWNGGLKCNAWVNLK